MLLLDVGNSRCKWARVEAGVWTHQGGVDNAGWQALQHSFAALPEPRRIIVSNVGGEIMAQHLRALCAVWQTPLEFVIAQSAQCGVSSAYQNPSQLGSDRWAALVAAWHRVHRACLVVNCGTATTVDTLSGSGEFLGGLILPGLELMRQSLLRNTAQLEDERGNLQDFPRNTADAIYSGVVQATLGAIHHQHVLLQAAEAAECVLSGGAAGQIQAHLGIPAQRVDNLVLQGLQIIGETNA